MIRVTFFADQDVWEKYKAYAKSKEKTASELLNRHLKETIETNKDRIEKYKNGMQELINKLNDKTEM